VTFFKATKRRGFPRRDSIQPDGSKKSDEAWSTTLILALKSNFFKERSRGDPLEGILFNQMESRNQMEMVGSHLSVQKVLFFKERERRGSIRRDSIQPDGSKKPDGDGRLPSKRSKSAIFQGEGEEGIHFHPTRWKQDTR
jgi:hypothetical protein